MRPIDADLLNEEIKSLKVYVTGLRAGKGVLREYAEEYQKSILDIIDEQPTIEAEPVKHGRWLPQILLGTRVWDCSECKTIGSPQWKRCPVCEAKMDMEVKNELR